MYLTTIVATFLLVTAALSAPTARSLQDSCAAVQNSSLELNQLAKDASLQARGDSKEVLVTDVSSPLVWMEAKDQCDPGSLKQDSRPCIGRLSAALESYNSAIETVSEFPSCSEFARKVKPVLQKLHADMRTCVKSDSHEQSQVSPQAKDSQSFHEWQKPLLCHYTMDRLFSFSILTARVFGHGDPAHHTEGSAEKCI